MVAIVGARQTIRTMTNPIEKSAGAKLAHHIASQ